MPESAIEWVMCAGFEVGAAIGLVYGGLVAAFLVAAVFTVEIVGSFWLVTVCLSALVKTRRAYLKQGKGTP